MARTVHADVVTASKAAHVGIAVFLVRLGFDSGDVLVTNAPFDIPFDWNAAGATETFTGVGQLGKVGAVEESVDVQPYSIALELSGIDAANVAIALGETYQGRDCRVWMAILNDDTHAIKGTPTLHFRGRLDTMHLLLVNTAAITVIAHSRLADWERARVRRWTNEDQQLPWSGDLGFAFTAETSEAEIIWGTA